MYARAMAMRGVCHAPKQSAAVVAVKGALFSLVCVENLLSAFYPANEFEGLEHSSFL